MSAHAAPIRPQVDRHAMAALIVIAGVATILWAHLGKELIPVRGGLGYDGATYAGVVRNPSGWLLDAHISGHRVQRILPSLLIHLVLRPFGLQAVDTAIILAFQVYNFAMLVVGVYVWNNLANHLRLSRQAVWFGYFALFVNYPLLKLLGYYPVLTDVSGFLLGLALLHAFLLRRPSVVLFIALIGAFTWPTVLYSGLLLYVMSKPRLRHQKPRSPLWAAIAATATAVAVATASTYALICGTGCVAGPMMRATLEALVPVSLPILGGWVILATYPLYRYVALREAFTTIRMRRIVAAVGLLALISIAQSALSTPNEHTLFRTLMNVSIGGIAKPAGHVVSHTAYFGPAVLLAVVWWRRWIAGSVAEQGLGLTVLMLGYALLTVGIESRLLMNVWPFVAVFTAIAANKAGWQWRQVLWFGGLSLVVSRVWLPINWTSWTGDYLAYPDQLYFMSNGPRMTVLSYFIMASVTAGAGAALWWISRLDRSAGGTGGSLARELPTN